MKSNIISIETLEEIVEGVLKEKADDRNNIAIEEPALRKDLYLLVLDSLKRNDLFYKGLNSNVLLGLYKKHVSKYSFKTLTTIDIMEEYDSLVWKKVNGLPYDQGRFGLLKRKFEEVDT